MRWILIFLLTTQAVMCGQKGPLELPDAQLEVPAATPQT